MNNKIIYQDSYFQNRYKNIVGDFTQKDLELSKRWFYSWLNLINKHKEIKNGDGRDALEIGCAIGGPANILLDWGYDVIASDISKLAVKKAGELNKSIKFDSFDVERTIPIKKNFDLIIAFEVVEHLYNSTRAIDNIYAKLKSDGIFAFSTPYPYSWSWEDGTHVNVNYPNFWLNQLRMSGFKNVKYYKFCLLPYFYRFNKNFQLTLPFHIPISFLNNPIIYIGEK